MSELPDLSIRHLRAIVAVSSFGKFTAAATELGLSQPGLSRLVQQAEDMLRVPLFSRGTRAVVPTAAGRFFIPAAERLLSELQQQVRQIRSLDGELHGQLTISSLMSLCHHVVPSALTAFRNEHAKIHIRVREGLNSDVQEDLRTGIADLGIGDLNASNRLLTVDTAAREICHVALPPGHRLAEKETVDLADLTDECMISMPPELGLRRLVDRAALREGVILNHGIVISQYQSLFGFVRNRLGVAIVPSAALSPAHRTDLVIRDLRPSIQREIGILHPSDRPLTQAAVRFLDFFRPMFLAATGSE